MSQPVQGALDVSSEPRVWNECKGVVGLEVEGIELLALLLLLFGG